MAKSKKMTMNSEDWAGWAKNTLLFSTPALLALLTSLQSGADLNFALGAAYSAFLGSAIDLLKKFNSGK